MKSLDELDQMVERCEKVKHELAWAYVRDQEKVNQINIYYHNTLLSFRMLKNKLEPWRNWSQRNRNLLRKLTI